MNMPRFPQDFKVLYAEGASYWWWSPFTGPDFDGTVPADTPFPIGLMVGNEEHTTHELIVGDPVIAIWTDFGEVHHEQKMSAYQGDDMAVQIAVELCWISAGIAGLIPEVH